MKQSTVAAVRGIRWMRCVRPLIDCCLLLLGLFLFMYFDNISMKKQVEKYKPNRVSHAIQAPAKHVGNQQKPVSIVQHFSSETEMWHAFSNWLHAYEAVSGNCRIETRPDLDQTPYSMQCAGSSNTKNNRPEKNANQNALFASNVLVAPEKISHHTNKKNETHGNRAAAEKNTTPVSGWINTPSGRRHFDPASKRWLP